MVREQSVDGDADRRWPALPCKQPNGLDHRASARNDVVDEHGRASLPSLEISKRNPDVPVPMTNLLQNTIGCCGVACHCRNPLFALAVRTDDEGLLDVRLDPLRNQRCRVNDARRYRVNLAQIAVPVKMRVDGHHPVECLGDKARHLPGRHRLTGIEAAVLSHIGQVRSDQPHLRRAKLARGRGGKDEGKNFFVRMRQRADDRDGSLVEIGGKAKIGFSVRKLPRVQFPRFAIKLVGKFRRQPLVARHRK